MARPVSAVPTNFTAEGAGVPNNIPLLDGNFAYLVSLLNDLSLGFVTFTSDTGTANNYVLTLPSTPSAYNPGMAVGWVPSNTNTGPSVVNINSLGNKSIFSQSGSPLLAGQLQAGNAYLMLLGGTNFRLITPAADTVTVGEVRMFAGQSSSVPGNWLLCNGQSLSTASFPLLFGVIGYTYGGSGANFNVPNLLGKFPQHNTPGQTGGTISASVPIAINNLPAHNHPVSVTINDPGHTHTFINPIHTTGATVQGGNTYTIGAELTGSSTTGITASASSGFIGGGSPIIVPTLPPFLTFNFIIRAF